MKEIIYRKMIDIVEVKMQSIVSYKERGNYGNAKYRGNCSGYIIKDLIEQFFPNTTPKKFIEVFSGRWNWKRCCK